ncbi:MAG: ABC transporter permease [Planctomycetota bacterium]
MRAFLFFLAVGLFVLIALVPPLYLLVDAFFVDGAFTLENYRIVLLDERQATLLLHSLLVGLGTCAIAFLLGVPFGYTLARIRLPLLGLFRCLYLVPVMIPTYIMGIAWTEYFDFGGYWGSVILLGLCYWPVVALFAERGFRSIGAELEDAALIRGTPLRAFLSVTLRLALPSILAGELFVFILAIGDFGIPDFLSFTSLNNYQVYTLEIFNRWSVLESTGEAIASSVPIIVVAVLAVWAILLLEGKGGGASITPGFRKIQLRPAGGTAFPIFIFLLLCVGASTILPLVTLVIWVNRAGSADQILAVMREAFDNAGADILNSILSAALASLLMVVVGFFIAYAIERRRGFLSRVLTFASLLPLAFPPVMLAVADIRLWNHPDNPLSDAVYGTRFELILVYFARFIPIAILSLRASVRQVDYSLEEASSMAGRGFSFTCFRVLLPLVWSGICAAFLLGYILCMRELDSITLISAGNDTLPQRIYSQVHTSRDVGIGALSIVLVFTLLVPPAIYRLLVRGRIRLF